MVRRSGTPTNRAKALPGTTAVGFLLSVVFPCFIALRPTFVLCFLGSPTSPLRGLHIDNGGRGFQYSFFQRFLEQPGWVFRVNVTLLSELVK